MRSPGPATTRLISSTFAFPATGASQAFPPAFTT